MVITGGASRQDVEEISREGTRQSSKAPRTDYGNRRTLLCRYSRVPEQAPLSPFFQIDVDAFATRFMTCQDLIRKSLEHPREIFTVALH
ncbi:hypothetical protein JG688_00017166 [Phytophthora aleatoria]|uniref:Uncharacterized protein n=1 Tax=Phytophthora aleatoria TaxID=2496075 RepID=A0A8J5I2W4_9STRA|nr:hypothetical protein JG688_00017166 [Phytophthora aleatoria]